MGAVTTYTVSGMGCGHCVASVTEALGKLEGVTNVDVDLASARVTVKSVSPVDPAAVAAAASEAGYEVLA